MEKKRGLRLDRPHAWEDGEEALEGDHVSAAHNVELGAEPVGDSLVFR